MIYEIQLSGSRTSPHAPFHGEHPDLIIQGGTAVTMVPGQKPISDATTPVLIQKDRILKIGPSSKIPIPRDLRVEIVDARDAIIMPGLVNAHAHTAMTLFRGFADDLPLNQWLFDKIFPAEAEFLSPETVYRGAFWVALK